LNICRLWSGPVKRVDKILKYADLSGVGIEVAPYFNPAVPKKSGRNILIMDVFDTETLRAGALKDPLIPDSRIEEIEEVDLVGDASSIGEVIAKAGLQGQIDYIVSSHNFEHLPNPILFLQGAYEALNAGGTLSMAVPDCRASFDHFRFPTRLADWLAAYHEERRQPSPETVFDGKINMAMYIRNGKAEPGCDISIDDPSGFDPKKDLVNAYEEYKEQKTEAGDYRDAHCSLFFPESLEQLLTDLQKLGLIKLEILEISKTKGLEFYVHLRKPHAPLEFPEHAFYKRRHELLVKVSRNLGAAPFGISPWAICARRVKSHLNKVQIWLKNRLRWAVRR
jgi:predicted SAM-dependent methyltransferase